MDKAGRIRELTDLLNKASRAYYAEDAEIMSNFEYDRLYDELKDLETETGITLPDSPTVNVGYESGQKLAKERHELPALSLDKTKDVDTLADFLGDQQGILSWKLDGITIVLTYEDGGLKKAVTRGNGEIGEVVTPNAKTFVNLPLTIPCKEKLIVRGEAVIKYSDFEIINEQIADADAKYKNPRNLCSGSVRQLDPGITSSRRVNLIVFSLVSADNVDFNNSNENKFKWLTEQGFEVVERKIVTKETVASGVREFSEAIEDYDIPSDGLVLLLDDIAYGESLGKTAKFPKNAIAFKWMDETAETVLKSVEWSPSRTGLINPVAIFDPVELEGTTVTRASLHNLSIIESMNLGIGDSILVYKANMIIPQIAENLTNKGGLRYPSECPACGSATVIKKENETKTLCCPNPLCPAKKIRLFTDFVSRNAMNIDGISEETLDKFIGHGFISEFADIYRLDRFREEITGMEGFGERSYENIINSVNNSRDTTAARLINSLGIPGVGSGNAGLISRHFHDDIDRIRSADRDDLVEIEGIGDVLADNIVSYFRDPENSTRLDDLLTEVSIRKEESSGEADRNLEGMTFVITGSLEHYENRDALKALIEQKGGRVAGSVSSKTSYLINNDINSSSSKNKKAKELGVKIITEENFIELFVSDNV